MSESSPESPIKALREAIGMSQAELSQLTGLAQSRLSNYERLERTPDVHTARLIVSVLKANGSTVTSIDELYPRTTAA